MLSIKAALITLVEEIELVGLGLEASLGIVGIIVFGTISLPLYSRELWELDGFDQCNKAFHYISSVLSISTSTSEFFCN